VRDELSQLRRELWLTARRVDGEIATLRASMRAAELIMASAADRDLEQVYEAQHRFHSDAAACAALCGVRSELVRILGDQSSVVGG
jgi:hypothetical protein